MNNAWEALMLLTRLKVSYDSILIQAKDQVQAIRIALTANKASLIIRCVVQFHLFQYPKSEVPPGQQTCMGERRLCRRTP